ncbi:TPA: hypothetical protein DIC62_00660 [Candidatus Nomurabacteria bacterium]|nr:hypothetical protein [Candidatus Nomurabacteria bacterium]
MCADKSYSAYIVLLCCGVVNHPSFWMEIKVNLWRFVMKKFLMLVMVVVLGSWLSGATESNAATKLLPAGAKVSATVSNDGIAHVSVTGAPVERIELYTYEGVKDVKASKATMNLREEGRRFQVVLEGGFYALLTPEMAAVPCPDFFGPGTGLDCSNTGGCAFIVTGKK